MYEVTRKGEGRQELAESSTILGEEERAHGINIYKKK